MIEFVFMLTRDDVTVGDAADVLASLRESGLRYVGFKDVGPPPQALAAVTAAAHDAGMEVMLEVVSTSAEDELRSLRAALDDRRRLGARRHARRARRRDPRRRRQVLPVPGHDRRPPERAQGLDRRDRRATPRG